MASPIGAAGSLTIKADDNGATLDVRICETAIVSEGLSLSTWGAAFVLAQNLYKIKIPTGNHETSAAKSSPSDQPFILELGAGTGLVGLTAAALWKAHVILTDLPLILPGIAANVSSNAQLLKQHGGSAFCGSLDWTNPEVLQQSAPAVEISATNNSNKPEVILAADTIYAEEHPELLVDTIKTWLVAGSRARVIMCYPLRMAYIDHIRDFWERMEEAGLECYEEGREEGIEEWNEVANTPFEWCVWRWKHHDIV